MKLTRRKIYNQCLIALTGVVIMISSIQVVVLCNGENGHFAVESAGSVHSDDLYTSYDKSTTPLEGAFSSSKDNRGPCVDTPIPVVLAKISNKLYPVNPRHPASTTVIASTIASYDFSEYHLGSELFASINPSLAFLRTIILLT